MITGALQTLVAASLGWFLASSLWIYPHSLSYFNESIGGPLNGPKHLLGSNVDWGQDLLYASARATQMPKVESVKIVFETMFDPKRVGISVIDQIPTLQHSALDDNTCAENRNTLGSNGSRRLLLIAGTNLLQEFYHEWSGTPELQHFIQQWQPAAPVSYSMNLFFRRRPNLRAPISSAIDADDM